MRQVLHAGRIPVIERHFDDLHSGVPRLLQQFVHCRSQKSQVFGDDLFLADPRLHRPEKLDPGALSPFAELRGLITVGNCIILGKAMEMINSYDVIPLIVPGDSLDPPTIFILLKC